MHKKEAGGSWRLALRAKRASHRQRSVCCCAGGSPLRDAQAKLAPPPPAAVFSTHGSSGAAMPRRHGPLRRYDGSVQVRFNAIRDRQACAERVAFATSRTLPCAACGRKPGYWPDLVGRVLAPDRKSFPKYKAEKISRAASLNVSAPTGQWAPDLTCSVSPVRRSMSSRRSVRTFSTVGTGCASGCIGWAVGPTATSAASMATPAWRRGGAIGAQRDELPNQASLRSI